MAKLTAAVKELDRLNAELTAHVCAAKKEEDRLREEIRKHRAVLEMSAAGIDFDQVALAKTILRVRGTYAKAGADRASVIADAIKQIATGEPIRQHYGDLWRVYFGTKDYDRWHGQRSDHEYGYGPGHGSTIFAVGLNDDVLLSRTHADLTPAEIEACVYYLTNLERVQTAEAEARSKAAA